MVPLPLYCASLALSFSRVGNAPADTTNIEITTATPAARDIADRADLSRTISLPPPKPLFPYLAANISSGSTSPHLVMSRNKRTSPPTAQPHRLLTGPRNYASVFPHVLVSISARSALRASLVGPAPCRRLVSISASPTLIWPSCAQRTTAGGAQVLCSGREFPTTC